MQKTFIILLTAVVLFSCKNNNSKSGAFAVNGAIKNTASTEVYLEELYFDQRTPSVLDTAAIKDGKFSLKGNATEEGIYRLRLKDMENGYLFINDKSQIDFTADVNDSTIGGAKFNTPANTAFIKFLEGFNKHRSEYTLAYNELQLPATEKNTDSILAARKSNAARIVENAKNFITNTLDSTTSPALAMFVMGYTMDIDTAKMKGITANLEKKFPGHNGLKALITRYHQAVAAMNTPQNQPEAPGNSVVRVGMSAPDLSMPGTDGKPVSISRFKGKYVLIDFWASWCGPCRMENPNVVAAFKKFQNKNFTILGVSLDEDKAKWLKAIADDQLTWSHMSDLKGWGSAAGSVYGVNSIPFNVLLDPTGKVIATDLRGPKLDATLTSILK